MKEKTIKTIRDELNWTKERNINRKGEEGGD